MNEQKKYLRVIEAVAGCSVKKVFLKISHNIQEITCARVSFFNKVAGLRPATLLQKRLWHRYLPENFAKFLRTTFLPNTKYSETKADNETQNIINIKIQYSILSTTITHKHQNTKIY